MPCPDEMMIARYAMGVLPRREAVATSAHCLRCDDCQLLVRALSDVTRPRGRRRASAAPRPQPRGRDP